MRVKSWNQILRVDHETTLLYCKMRSGRIYDKVHKYDDWKTYSSPLAPCFHCGTMCTERKRANVQRSELEWRMKEKMLGCMAVVSLWIFWEWNVYPLGGKCFIFRFMCPRWEIDINAAASTNGHCVFARQREREEHSLVFRWRYNTYICNMREGESGV